MTHTSKTDLLRVYLRQLFADQTTRGTNDLRQRWNNLHTGGDDFRNVMYQLAARDWIRPSPGRHGEVEMTRDGRHALAGLNCRVVASPREQSSAVDVETALAALRDARIRAGMVVQPEQLGVENAISVLTLLQQKNWVRRNTAGLMVLTAAGHEACWAPAKGLMANHRRWLGMHSFKAKMSASPAHRCTA